MHVFITGSSGLIGSRLVSDLQRDGHQVTRLVRGSPREGEMRWSYQEREIDLGRLEAADAVVHLAGESIAAGRWNEARKKRIRESRVLGTEFLAQALAKLARRPRVMVSASAIGYYGDRGDEELTEASPPGQGFLPEVCQEWEAACRPAEEAGVRVAHLRTGVVLSAEGGALAKMLLPFKLGAGGRIGDGRQWWSWIALDDLVGAIRHALQTPAVAGPVNGVAPHPVTNQEFTKTLGRVLGRPTIFPMPAFAARLALGEMANDLLLASARVLPRRLQETGYQFRYPDLEPALRHVLGGAG